MATFVIGDIHGKYKQLKELLQLIAFDQQQDTLWCTGDLVNRGKKSLEVLQFCEALGDRFVTVLGNHDVFLLALYHGYSSDKKPSKCLQKILDSADVDRLMKWLQAKPFLHYQESLQAVLVHAGLPPLSSLEESLQGNQQLQGFFQSADKEEQLKDFLCHHLMGNEPRYINDAETNYDRYRYFINCFTRMRYCDLKGAPRYGYKGTPQHAPQKRTPWYALPQHPVISKQRVLFGHWATLATYRINVPKVHHLDTGCAWGGHLTALCLDGCTRRGYAIDQRFAVSCC
jgi:bis(5'-nucleosyl)-tetraphosphatase (symmetrical)